MDSSNPVKLIELEDKFTCKAHQFPYVMSIKSKIRFRLRSKICFHYEPIILIEKLSSFDYMLPLKKSIDISSPKVLKDFTIVKGNLTQDGAWQAELPPSEPGVISFQLVFFKQGSTISDRFGTCEVILLCQDKFDLRKLRSMTVFARCIGPVSEWLNFFRSQQILGYNTFHLAPIQQTGASNSYYSLKNHLELSDYLFSGSQEQKNAQLESVLEQMKKEGMVFFIDIILNHTSFDSVWIQSQPDAVYTVDNTPMLYPSFLVDMTIFEWGEQVKQMMSFDTELTEEIMTQIEENLTSRLNSLELPDYFLLSPDLFEIMLSLVPTRKPSDNIFAKDPIDSIDEFLDANHSMATEKRFGITIDDVQKWVELNLAYEENDLRLAIEAFNSKWRNRVQNEWIPEMIKNTMNEVRRNYLDNNYRSFDDAYPLVNKYFSKVQGVDGDFYALNNGWVGGNDSRQLFVIAKEYYYLRRKICVWGDLIRIRYGNKPSDSPAAWEYMLSYVREMAKYFDGFRMDNLHGTPIYVAKHMIKEARKVNPNLIVFAELFTSSEEETASFVRQIGINSTLKECQHLLSGGAFVHHFHRSINFTCPYLGTLEPIFIQNQEPIKYASYKRPIPLVYDLTHDNETYAMKNILILQTPVTLLLSMVGTFTGSTKGYDQFYSKKIYVTELRPLYSEDFSYPPVIDKSEVNAYLVTFKHGGPCEIVGSWNHWKQSAPLTYHKESDTYYTLVYLEPGEYEYKFKDGKDWILDKSKPNNGTNDILKVTPTKSFKSLYRNLQPLRKFASDKANQYYSFKEYHVYNIGDIVIVIREPVDHLESICVIVNLSKHQVALNSDIGLTGNIVDCDVWLQSELSIYEGLTTQTEIAHTKNINQYFEVTQDNVSGNDKIRAPFLPSGFSCFIHCKKNAFHREMITSIDQILSKPIYLPPLGPLEINGLFFNCAKEEEHLWGQTNYVIPQDNHQLVYAGFAGVFSIILRAKRTKNLGEGLYNNLREGNWLMDFFLSRCRRYKHLSSFVQYLEKVFGVIGSLPRYLVPKYFTKFVYSLMLALKAQTKKQGDFQRTLQISASQFINYFPNCSLPDKTLVAAGLPHFAVGWPRCWGRDTFTSSDLLRLHPNIFRESILQFASAMRHGLIPNLLDEGRRPRYNCRDACWWFIRSIGEYIDETKDYEILKNKVQMLFFSSDKHQHQNLKSSNQKKKVMLLEEIVQEIFRSHAHGITFREWNAGYEIDTNMTSDGFNISLEVDGDTGFIIGGNPFNCLTWMDKMGSSTHAATKGIPATPRAGAPIELVGLLYVCLKKFNELHKSGHYSFQGVKYQGRLVSFQKWMKKITYNFEKYFYLKEVEDVDPKYIKGIYKDLVFSPVHFDEERLRCNGLITLALAPELCDKAHAQNYIRKVQEFLIKQNSLGVGTLSEHHTVYCPYYDNNDDSAVAKTAHGFSYHNGPQWIWFYGFYLTAKINFERETLSRRRMMTLLQNHIKVLNESEWQSYAELTNVNGEYNSFSCKAQAWSVSSILMAMKSIQTLPDDI